MRGERGPVVDVAAEVPVPTLWDLAAIVLDEVEKVCKDEECVLALSREILIHIIQTHVRNMEVVAHDISAERGRRHGMLEG
jgi:hypothetical protein